MKYTSLLVAFTANVALGDSFIDSKSKCRNFLTESKSLTSQNNEKPDQSPFLGTTAEPEDGSAVTDVTPAGGTGTTEALPETTATIIILDETGSMQFLGGREKRQGRHIVIKKVNQFMTALKQKIDDGEVDDSELTFVTFNRKARFVHFDSIMEMPELKPEHYNPGYGTNLYDTIGCVLSKFHAENPDMDNVNVYVISDGAHKLSSRDRSRQVGYQIEDIKDGITSLRESGWNFNIYGAVNKDEKERLKKQALAIGFNQSERKMFDFTGGDMNKLMKTMLRSFGKSSKPKALPDCKVLQPCAKGKAGKMCRKRRKTLENQGKCLNLKNKSRN